jgi:hypothetical protein
METVSGPPAWGFGRGGNKPPTVKPLICNKKERQPWTGWIIWHDFSTKTWKRSGTWNVRSLYMTYSLKTLARELGKYNLDLVVVQEVIWEKGSTEHAEDYTFYYGEGNGEHQLGTGFSYMRKS